MKKQEYAQFFTPQEVALLMADLSKNKGRFFEPSCGSGVLTEALIQKHSVGWVSGVSIELDATVAPEYRLVMDFFEYPINEKFSTVISNPPYISHKAIPQATQELSIFKQLKAKLGGLSNLYSAFILKSFLHLEPNGELVFVVPEECFRTTSNFKLFDYLHKHGTFTDVVKFKKTPFKEVSQDVVVFRCEKDDFSYQTNVRIL